MRVTLGATPRRIVRSVFKQPLRQLGMGLLAGTALVAYMVGMMKGRNAVR